MIQRIACRHLVSLILGFLAVAPIATAHAEFDEAYVIIEINATDGDAGFHGFLDADAWRRVWIRDPNNKIIFQEQAWRTLRTQGLTENFFESAEPVCDPADDEDGDAVSLAEFIARFPAGEYKLFGMENEGGGIFTGAVELTYNLPAAPDISASEGTAFVAGDDVVVSWAPGEDLGEKCHDQDLIDAGIIADPAEVAVVSWEIVVEPADEDAVAPARVFTLQLPPGQTEVTVPAEFIETYGDDGVEQFKFEVGSIEKGGNRTFSEGQFCIVESAGDECPEEE